MFVCGNLFCKYGEMGGQRMGGLSCIIREYIDKHNLYKILSSPPHPSPDQSIYSNLPSSRSGKKLIFFSAHDSTLTAVMEALGIWDATWPPYGSDIRMELFQKPDTQDYFVKVVYNGTVRDYMSVFLLRVGYI